VAGGEPRLPALDGAAALDVDQHAPAVYLATIGTVKRFFDAALLLVPEKRMKLEPKMSA
jgi:hypothetical protein